MDYGTRDQLLSRLADAVESMAIVHTLRVAFDGPPAAGKTTLADELAVDLRARGREVIRASIESFLLPQAERYRRGEHSPEGCYLDSFDYDALNRVLLEPPGRRPKVSAGGLRQARGRRVVTSGPDRSRGRGAAL